MLSSFLYQKFVAFLNKYGWLIVLLVAALAKVYILVLNDTVIADDGIFYINQAQQIVDGTSALSATLFNLFPLMIAAVYLFLNLITSISYETAALLLTTICGLGIIIPLYLITKRYFGNPAAIVTGLYLCLLPELTEITCSVLREAPALCLIAWAIYLFLKAIQSNNPQDWSLIKLSISAFLIIFAGLIRLEMFIFAGPFTITLLVAHIDFKNLYRPFKRLMAVLVFVGVFVLIGGAGFTALNLKNETLTLGPLDRIFQQNGLNDIKVKQDPFEIDKSLLYDAQGKMRPHVLVRYQFTHLARDHRRFLYMFEIVYKEWKALNFMGLILLFLGIWALIKYRTLKIFNPLILSSIMIYATYSVVFYLYASTHYYIGTRHVLSLILPLSLIMGVWTNYIPKMLKIFQLFAVAILITCMVIFCYKSLRPIRAKKLPLKVCGLELAQKLPSNAVIFTTSDLRPAVFYANAEYRMFNPLLPIETLSQRMAKGPDRFLLINSKKSVQIPNQILTNLFSKVELNVSPSKRYDFSLYIPHAHKKL